MPQLTLEQLVRKLASRKTPRTEATVQADVRQLLLEAPLNLTDEVLLEPQVGDGRRIDVEVGATVIEVKKDLSVGNVRTEAVKQLRGYVESRQAKLGARYVGILTDGADWYGYRLQGGRLEEATKHQVDASRPNADALCIWLEGILATARDIRPTPEEIRQRLGADTSAHELDRASLAALFEANKDLPTVQTKRSLWARLLQTALGTQFDDSDELFIEHTLLVNTAEIIAHAVLGLAPEALSPRSLLSGEKFVEAGVLGVVEADFFDWVVEVQEGDSFVRSLARRIARFDWQAVEHDVLKVLYESVIRAEVRKKLGEYYTPDWLAEKMVETVIKDPLGQRVLDRVRVPERQHDLLALDLGLVADAVDLELAAEPVGHALEHVADERTHEPVRRALRAEVALALEHEDVLLVVVLGLLDLDVLVTLHRQGALGPLGRHDVVGDRDGDPLGDLERFTTDARHDSPDLAEDFAADALLPGLFVGHHALRRGKDGDTEAVADPRHLLGGDVGALARARHAAHAGDRAAGAGAAVVAERELEDALLAIVDGGHRLDEALVAEDLGEPELDVRARALDELLARADPVADAREEVSDGIGHRHGLVLTSST